MARVLIVGGGARGRGLARSLVSDGYAVRAVTSHESQRSEIEALGAECWIGTPDRIATLRGALDGVTVACWLLASADLDRDLDVDEQTLVALHGTRLEYWLMQMIDSTVRGFVYETVGSAPPAVLAHGMQLAIDACARNSIPLQLLDVDGADLSGWTIAARAAIETVMAG